MPLKVGSESHPDKDFTSEQVSKCHDAPGISRPVGIYPL